MKIVSKKIAAKVASVSKTAPAAKAQLGVLHAYDTKHCVLALKNGMDAAGAWLGKQIDDKVVSNLISNRERLSSSKLGKTDKVLFVHTKKAFAWPLTGVHGDIYERTHGAHGVRGFVSALKKAYGDKHVRIVSRSEAVKLLKTFTPEKASAKAFGVA